MKKMQLVVCSVMVLATYGCAEDAHDSRRATSTSASAESISTGEAEALFANTSAPIFNVKNGCPWKGSIENADGRGTVNDTVAIQNCLYAAGQAFATACPAAPWTEAGYPVCQPVEVFVPSGTYFVEGVWKTSYPEHSSANNSAYVDQWVVFTLPRGVAIRGEGKDGGNASTITLNKTRDCYLDSNPDGSKGLSDRCSEERRSKRTGTYLFMAGFEKMADFCDYTPSSGNPSPKNPGASNDLLCQPSVSIAERGASGAQNSFQDIALIGDRLALANHWYEGLLKSQSTAIHTYRARDLRLTNVKTDNWYRALNSREGNGVSVTGSTILNNFKASLYLSGPYANSAAAPQPLSTPPAAIYNFNIGYNVSRTSPNVTSRLPISIDHNEINNDPEFFSLLKAKGAAPWGGLNGVYVIGNNNSVGCSDASITSNKLRYAKIYFEQPCAAVSIQDNTVSYTGMPIQVGSYENNNGLNIAKSIAIEGNKINHSVSGILIRGCQYNTRTDRCVGTDLSPLISPLVRGNSLDNFLPLAGVGSDVWVSEMARSSKSLGGIVVADASLVRIDGNSISGLRKGSQSFGIGIERSRWNTKHGTGASCYEPITRSRGISITGNSISYAIDQNNTGANGSIVGLRDQLGRIKDAPVGIYVESSDNLTYSAGSMVGVTSNRLICSTFARGSINPSFCTSTETGSASSCPRRLDSSSSLMSRTCSPQIETDCVFTIPGLPPRPVDKTQEQWNAENPREFYAGICSPNRRDPSDEEMIFK